MYDTENNSSVLTQDKNDITLNSFLQTERRGKTSQPMQRPFQSIYGETYTESGKLTSELPTQNEDIKAETRVADTSKGSRVPSNVIFTMGGDIDSFNPNWNHKVAVETQRSNAVSDIKSSPRTAVGQVRVNKLKIQAKFDKFMKLSSRTSKNVEDPNKRNYKEFAEMIINENTKSKLKDLQVKVKNIPKGKKSNFQTPLTSNRVSPRGGYGPTQERVKEIGYIVEQNEQTSVTSPSIVVQNEMKPVLLNE